MITRRQFLGSTTLVAAGAAMGWIAKPERPYTSLEQFREQTTPQIAPITVTTAAGIRIHAIQTGFVAVKASHRYFSGPNALALPAIVFDPRWTDWMPIYSWVIEHPEGILVVDTGESSRSLDPEFFNCDPGSRFVYNTLLKFAVGPADEIGPQMRQLNLAPEDVRWVVQTHLHSDHADGLSHFPNAEIMVSPIDYPNGMGALACRYPAWLQPTLVNFASKPFYNFTESLPLTQAGDVRIVPTPGHALGHQSILLQDSEKVYFFAGDASFDETQLQQGLVAGISADIPTARQTLATIRAFCEQAPTVYLPSHDPASGRRLQQGQTVLIS